MTKKRSLLFSLNAKDFKWEFFRASGPGGQHRNKRDTACRCTHEPSGAVGIGTEDRLQRQNRVAAFMRCVTSDKFKSWHRLHCARLMKIQKTEEEILQGIDEDLRDPKKLKIEVKNEKGQWVESPD